MISSLFSQMVSDVTKMQHLTSAGKAIKCFDKNLELIGQIKIPGWYPIGIWWRRR